jgi:hypothetical protein
MLLLAGLLLTSILGCHSVGLVHRNQQTARTEPEPEPPLTTPSKYSLRIAPCVFFSDVELKREEPLFQDLKDLPEQVYRELRLIPSDSVVQVYLFEDQKRYGRYMKVKHNLPDRRAFFVKQERMLSGQQDLLIYTCRGPKIQQDLRHELTHALLNGSLKKVPLWLDEGLAEYFELPQANRGLNPAHVHLLRRDLSRGMQFDLARLESLTEVEQMNPGEYREAWAWVHLMLRSEPAAKRVLIDYLRQLRDVNDPPPLGPRLATVFRKPEEALVQHIQDLDVEQLEAINDPRLSEDKRHGQLTPR